MAERLGFPGSDEVAINALKRGRNGRGVIIEVNDEDSGVVFKLDPEDHDAITHAVDTASGEVGIQQAGLEVARILRTRLQDPSATVEE